VARRLLPAFAETTAGLKHQNDVTLVTAMHKREIAVEREHPIIAPKARPHYSLGELVRQSETKASPREKDREWLIGKPLGRELI